MGKYRRRVNIGSGMDAFSQAYGITRGVMKDYQASKAEDEITTLGSDAGAVEGEAYTVTAPDGTTSTGLVSRDSGADFDAIQQAYGEQGYKVERQEKPMFAARGGEGKDFSMHDSEAAAEAGSRKANHGLMRKKADVYQQHGMRDEASGLRREASQGERQDSQDAMALEQHGQQMKLGTLQVDAAQSQADARKRTEGFNAEFAELEKSGGIKTISDLRALAAKHNLSPQEQFQLATSKVGLDEAQTKSKVMQRIEKFDEAYGKGGLAGLKKMYNEDPLYDNGQDIDFVQGKGGIVTVVHGGNKVFSGTQAQVAAFLKHEAVDPIKAVSFAMEVSKFQQETRDREAGIGLKGAQAKSALASAANSYAGANKTRAETRALGSGGDYKIEANEVSSALGKPAVDERGRPITDDYGMQKFTRDPAEEDRFYKWMRANNLRDTNKALAIWKGGAGGANKPATPAPNPNRRPLSHFSN